MKIQLANITYHSINEGCCLDCAFWVQLNLVNLQRYCQSPIKCVKPFKKQLFNDKIFKL